MSKKILYFPYFFYRKLDKTYRMNSLRLSTSFVRSEADVTALKDFSYE